MVDRQTTDVPRDFPACDREPIQSPGHIQPFGFLIALMPDGRVSHVSANIERFTGVAAQAWLGQPLDLLISPPAAHMLRDRMTALHGPDAIERIFALSLIDGGPAFDIAIHMAGDSVVVEAEPAATDEREAAPLVRAMAVRLRHSETMADFLRDGARHVQALTGFDRVMVYRFDRTGDGDVVAEALRGRKDSYFGLHYPASDIPAQARALYLRSPFRVIADIAAIPVPILPDTGLDQSLSVLRAVAPVHIQYLRNMGVAASLSISIIVDGRLWGLFACHHYGARLPSFAYRTAAELFGELFSMMLERRERREAGDHDKRSRAIVDLMRAELALNPDLLIDAQRLGDLMFDVIPADGIGISLGGLLRTSGAAPDDERFAALIAELAERPDRGALIVGTIPPASGDMTGRPAGYIALPLPRSAQDHIVLFRCERLASIHWAGRPEKVASPIGGLSPRDSFEAWTELVRGQCDPFSAIERRAADMIRTALLETLVRISGDMIVPVMPAGTGQDMVIAELNHRVRNILALIRGLISQTRSGAETADSFIETLDERVQALARAHNQITDRQEGPARLSELIETEAEAYLGPDRDRVRITGRDVLIRSTAFTTLALVLHEMTTNAVKYGALSRSGHVEVEIALDGAGDLLVAWVEKGGPPVIAPSARGFGSTIIERSIPHDLGGAVTFDFPPAGFQARLRIPARHIAGVSMDHHPRSLPTYIALGAHPLTGRTVLLVEDNMIIAMDCEQALRSLGADDVITAATVADALAMIAATDFDIALLDFNLEDETSLSIADALAERAIPFAFATGYDGNIQNRGHENAPVVSKPYGVAQLVPMLHILGFAQDPGNALRAAS